jgi:hypothetical protein
MQMTLVPSRRGFETRWHIGISRAYSGQTRLGFWNDGVVRDAQVNSPKELREIPEYRTVSFGKSSRSFYGRKKPTDGHFKPD